MELLIGVIFFVLLALESWVLLKVLSQQGRLLLRLETIEAQLAANGMAPQPAPTGNAAIPVTGLPVGTLAPTFALSTLRGEAITLGDLRALGKPIVLVFSDPGCGPCNALLPEVGRWQQEHASNW
jgi:thiol-disulfide isomerase/thioredoxin